jgi:hypothetical protein
MAFPELGRRQVMNRSHRFDAGTLLIYSFLSFVVSILLWLFRGIPVLGILGMPFWVEALGFIVLLSAFSLICDGLAIYKAFASVYYGVMKKALIVTLSCLFGVVNCLVIYGVLLLMAWGLYRSAG